MKRIFYILCISIIIIFTTSCNLVQKDTDQYIHEISKQALPGKGSFEFTDSLSVSGLSFYERNKDIILEIGFGEAGGASVTNDDYAILEIRDINPELSYDEKKEDSKVNINGNIGECIKQYESTEVEKMKCEEVGKIVYYDDAVINMSEVETNTSGEIIIVMTHKNDAQDVWFLRKIKLYYYVGEFGIGCSFKNKNDAQNAYEEAMLGKKQVSENG